MKLSKPYKIFLHVEGSSFHSQKTSPLYQFLYFQYNSTHLLANIIGILIAHVNSSILSFVISTEENLSHIK